MKNWSFRGLLAQLAPTVAFDDGLVTVTLTVPDMATGEPFVLVTSERIGANAPEEEIDRTVRNCFVRALEHEAKEGLVVNGVEPFEH